MRQSAGWRAPQRSTMKSKRGCCQPRSESRDRPGTRKLFNVKTSEIQLHAFMTINCSAIFVAAMFALGAANESAAQTLAQRSLDIILEGDDPSEVFTFDLPFDALVPIRVSIDGLFENLDTSETGVRYKLWWPRADGGGIDGQGSWILYAFPLPDDCRFNSSNQSASPPTPCSSQSKAVVPLII